MPTSPTTSILAAVTQALPGPDDQVDGLDALVGEAVGERADRLDAARDEERVDARAGRRRPSRTGWTLPSRSAGLATTTLPTPATRAGTTPMTSDDGYGAEPPGA